MGKSGKLKYVPDDFWKWLKKSRKSWGITFIGAAIPIVIGILINLKPNVLNWIELSIVLLGFQALVALVLLLIIPEPLTDWDNARRASIASWQFHKAWRWLWFFWVILYCGLAAQEAYSISLTRNQLMAIINLNRSIAEFKEEQRKPSALGQILEGKEQEKPDAQKKAEETKQILEQEIQKTLRKSPLWSFIIVGANLLNNLQTLALLMCYMVVAKKTLPREPTEDSPPESASSQRRSNVSLPWLKGAAVLIFVTTAELLFGLSGETTFHGALKVFRYGSGMAAGLSLALLVGRLDSKLITLPAWVVVLGYLYAVLQAAWVEFPEESSTKQTLAIAALMLKTLLFLLVTWLFKSGVFLYYLNWLITAEGETKRERRVYVRKLQARQFSTAKKTEEGAKETKDGDNATPHDAPA